MTVRLNQHEFYAAQDDYHCNACGISYRQADAWKTNCTKFVLPKRKEQHDPPSPYFVICSQAQEP